MTSLRGTWLPLPGRIVDIAATSNTLVLAEVPEAGHPVRVHVGRWRDGQWAWEEPWSVPLPPRDCDPPESASLAVSEEGNRLHVAVTRVESQGGSYGMALATLARGSWIDLAEIESPTDSDIPFGAPARRHPHDIFTFEETSRLWQYTRSGEGWVARSIALRDGSVQLVAPHMALDARGLVVANENAAGEPVLLVFGTDELGRALAPTTSGLPARIEGMAFGGAILYLGFGRPDPVGAVIWAVSLPQTGRLAPVRRFSVPAPDDAAFTHVAFLDASADWLLVLQLDAAWVAATSGTTPLRRLELPASDAGLRRPTGVVVGSHAVVIVGDMFGTFALDE